MNKAVSVQAGGQAGRQAGPGGSFYPLRTFFSPFFCFGRRTRTRTKSENNSHVAVSQSVIKICTDKRERERERDSFCKKKKGSVVSRERWIAFARKKKYLSYLSFKYIYIYILWYICSISLSLSPISLHLPPSTIPPPLFLLLTKQSSQPNSPDTSSQETSSPHPTTKYSFHTP